MSGTPTKDDALARIEAARADWRALVAAVGTGRMERPGPMGAWTFKDLAAHLTLWREWTIGRVAAGPGREVPPPWPEGLVELDPRDPDGTDWDPVNAWIYAQNRDRPLADVLADADASFARLAAAVAALPDTDVTTPGRFDWLDGEALAAIDFAGHLREEHEPTLRAWLAATAG